MNLWYRQKFCFSTHLGKTTGVAITINVLGYCWRIPFWDFTHSHGFAARINAQLAMLAMPVQKLAVLAVNDNAVNLDLQTWGAWLRNGARGGATFLQLLKTCYCTILSFFTDSSLTNTVRCQFQQREESYQQQARAWRRYKRSFQDMNPDESSDHQHSNNEPYVLMSAAALIYVFGVRLATLTTLIDSEVKTLWWRRWLANTNHVNAYAAYLQYWQQQISAEKSKLAQACLERLQATLRVKNPRLGVGLYAVRNHSNGFNRAQLSLNDSAQELTAVKLVQLHEIYKRWGPHQFSAVCKNTGEAQAEFFAALDAFVVKQKDGTAYLLPQVINDAMVPPSTRLRRLIWRLTGAGSRISAGHAQMQMLFHYALKTPWLTQVSTLCDWQNLTVVNHFSQLTRIRQARHCLQVSSPHQRRWLVNDRRCSIAWQIYLDCEEKRIVRLINQQATALLDYPQHDRLITPENSAVVKRYFKPLQQLMKTHHSVTPMLPMQQALAMIERRLEELADTPAKRHLGISKLFERLLAGEVVSAETLAQLLTFYQQGPFDVLDYPDDIYALNYENHRNQYHQHVNAMLNVVKQIVASLNDVGALDSPLVPLARLHIFMSCLMKLQVRSHYVKLLIKTVQRLLLAWLSFMVDGTVNNGLAPQLLLKRLLAICELSSLLDPVRREVLECLTIISTPLGAGQRKNKLQVVRYILTHSLLKHQLLDELSVVRQLIASSPSAVTHATQNLTASVWLLFTHVYRKNVFLTYIDGLAEYIEQEAHSLDKLDALRRELQLRFNLPLQRYAAADSRPSSSTFPSGNRYLSLRRVP
jgi:hypothetical protein